MPRSSHATRHFSVLSSPQSPRVVIIFAVATKSHVAEEKNTIKKYGTNYALAPRWLILLLLLLFIIIYSSHTPYFSLHQLFFFSPSQTYIRKPPQ